VLNFTMRLPTTDSADKACFALDGRNSTMAELPALQLGSGWESGKRPAIWNGLPSQVRSFARTEYGKGWWDVYRMGDEMWL
jgi:alpha-D-ribose 1-methylphosphonate 5-triphosphate synthase subunit PhnH